MKNLKIHSKKTNFFLSFLTLFLLFSAKSVVLAEDINISANIPDLEAPSAPILIEPSDGAILSDSTPSFKWYESTDNLALSHYVFYLNNNVFYSNVPLVDTDNSHYLLDYDGIDGTYTLTPKNALSDGSATWKIVAVDYAGLSASSDIWDFRIDTQAPSFILTKIGDTVVSISAADVGTVPSSPILIFQNDATANEPILIAGGEANSNVQLTVIIPDDPTQIFNTTIDSSGYYELKLGILPRDVDIRLDFIITDQAGQVSVLEKVYFRISLQYWPTATPTTITTTPTTTPTLSPSVSTSVEPSSKPSISPTLTLTQSPAPTGIIPIVPPKEIIHEVGDELIELLPETTGDYLRTFLKSKTWLNLSLFLTSLFLLLFYFSAFLLLLSKFMKDISISLLKKVSMLLFPFIFKANKHLVFEYKETLASPLVKVELFDQNEQLLDFTITNLQGNFNDLNFPISSSWRLQVKDGNFYYPIGDEKPNQLDFWQFYQNQMFDDENYHGQPILIPTLRATGQEKLPFFERLRIFVLYLLDYPLWFLIISLLFALLFALRYQSMFNSAILLVYLFILIYKLFYLLKKQKSLNLLVKLSSGNQFSNNLIMSLFEEGSEKAQSLVMPFEFSKSKVIKHSFDKVFISAFAKNYALEKDGLISASQLFSLEKKEEEIPLEIKKI